MTSTPDTSRAAPPQLDQGLRALAEAYDLILCDVWGVVHNGVAYHRAAVDALRRFRRGGGTVVLITNAPAPAKNVIGRLATLGAPQDFYDAVATSGDVTATLIAEAGCPPVYNIGPAGELDLYQEAARLGPRAPDLVDVAAAGLAVAIGVSQDPGVQLEDYDASLRALQVRGLVMICANPDIVVEVGDRMEYCAGAIAERYEAMGGTVIQAGKPFPAIYERALRLVRDKIADVPRHRILAIGDAMHTDMQGAHDQGFDALFITSGIHWAELHGGERGSPLDRAALRQFLDARTAKPIAAMSALAWEI
ncbi:MAG: TIGR01459 family HAD-type hydrolase [Beijerinckiaceae bacterium]|nr:TIGR01459 family HAD-type hydrolase [Beijerinckiaceae bacterium]